ncbi:MAG: Abi family protein [Bacteroidaceae bacterium]|nr:Abi family protein [Bacteroidaceae bacterium]
MAVNFDKSYTSPEVIVDILQKRGLNIDNRQLAADILKNVGYYRFSAYLYPFLMQPKEEHVFKQDGCFGNAWELYRFDKKLLQMATNLFLAKYQELS